MARQFPSPGDESRHLHDDTMPLDTRTAAGLLLLFGTTVSTLVRTQAGHIEQR
jgi:hypothetical protein